MENSFVLCVLELGTKDFMFVLLSAWYRVSDESEIYSIDLPT